MGFLGERFKQIVIFNKNTGKEIVTITNDSIETYDDNIGSNLISYEQGILEWEKQQIQMEKKLKIKLEEQLELLSEKSRGCLDLKALGEASLAMVEITKVIIHQSRFL